LTAKKEGNTQKTLYPNIYIHHIRTSTQKMSNFNDEHAMDLLDDSYMIAEHMKHVTPEEGPNQASHGASTAQGGASGKVSVASI
jgi:hypothetical protein